MNGVPDDIGTRFGAEQLEMLAGRVRREAAESIARAGVEVGRLIGRAELYFEDSCDVLEQLARQLGVPDAGALVLDAVGRGMEHPDDVAEATPGELTDAPAPPEPSAAPETLRAAFRDADECAAAVVAWASERLTADPNARTASADLAEAWQTADGRSLVGYSSITEAIRSWAQMAGVAAGRYRTARGRGLTGLRLAASAVDDTLPGGDTDMGVTPPEDDTRSAAESTQQRPPSGGRWQTVVDIEDAANAGSDGWFEV